MCGLKILDELHISVFLSFLLVSMEVNPIIHLAPLLFLAHERTTFWIHLIYNLCRYYTTQTLHNNPKGGMCIYHAEQKIKWNFFSIPYSLMFDRNGFLTVSWLCPLLLLTALKLSGPVGKSWYDIDSGKTSSRRQSIFCPPEIPRDLYLGQTQTPDDSHLTRHSHLEVYNHILSDWLEITQDVSFSRVQLHIISQILQKSQMW